MHFRKKPASRFGICLISGFLVLGLHFGAEAKTSISPPLNRDYSELVTRHAAANSVPADLGHALIQIESRHNPRITNAGAYGLMQITYSTARSMGYTGPASGLLNPDTNLRYGMKYLGQAYAGAGGDICHTVAHYQIGHPVARLNATSTAHCKTVKRLMHTAFVAPLPKGEEADQNAASVSVSPDEATTPASPTLSPER